MEAEAKAKKADRGAEGNCFLELEAKLEEG
jgi:hypothetical protein